LKLNQRTQIFAVKTLFVIGSELLCSNFAAGAVEQPPAQAPVRAVSKQPFVSSLRPMLRTISHVGWEDLGLKAYSIADGRLVSSDTSLSGAKNLSSTSQPGPPNGADQAPGGENIVESFSLPVSGNEVAILDEFACQAISQKVFRRGNRYITIRAFEFAESDGANAGYDLLRKGSTTVVKRGDGSSEDSDSISFWQDKCLFVLSGSSQDDEESKEVITKFAQNLSKMVITHAQPPAVLSRLPVIDRVRGSEKIVMGPISASRYFPAPDLHSLQIDAARSAAIADYQILYPARERLKLLYIDYGDPKIAEEVFNAYQGQLEQLHSADQVWPEQQKVLFKLNKVYLMLQVKQPGRLIVIYGARKARSPMLLSGQIR
jgi:hypothetical protein